MCFHSQCCVVFHFHFCRARQFRISNLVQNIIIFWHYIYNNISQEKWIFHLRAWAVTDGLAFLGSTVLINWRKPCAGLKCTPTPPDGKLNREGNLQQTGLEFTKRYGKRYKILHLVSCKNKSQWPFIQRRIFPGLVSFKIYFFLTLQFSWLVFNRIFTQLSVFLFYDIFGTPFRKDFQVFGFRRKFYDQVLRKQCLFLVWDTSGTGSQEIIEEQQFCGISYQESALNVWPHPGWFLSGQSFGLQIEGSQVSFPGKRTYLGCRFNPNPWLCFKWASTNRCCVSHFNVSLSLGFFSLFLLPPLPSLSLSNNHNK